MIWLLAHVAGYVTLALTAVRQALRVSRRRIARSHRKCVERIARLEMDIGVGLDWGREFFATRKPVKRDYGCKNECWSCGARYYADGIWAHNRDAELAAHLCVPCERKAHAELAAL